MSHTQMRHLSHTNVSSVSHLCIVNVVLNDEVGRALRSTSNQSSEPREVAQHPEPSHEASPLTI